MNSKSIIRILQTPRCWIRSYQTNQRLDAFVRTLIDHKEEVEFVGMNRFTINLRFRGRIYVFWISNHPYASLSQMTSKNDERDFELTKNLECMPSRETVFDFFDTFVEPNLHKVKKDDPLDEALRFFEE